MTASPRLFLGDIAPIQPLAAWGTAEAPPTAFRIFHFGENRATQNGKPEIVYLTPKKAAAIVAEWRRRRIAGAFDYEHAVAGEAKDKAKGVPAAGWFSLAVRSDGLWAVGITWLESALNYFKKKEYRYFSPYFYTNAKGEVIGLYNVALTNWPATDGQRPLIALSFRLQATPKGVSIWSTMTADEAKALADKYISACKGDSAFTDSLALMILADETAEPGEVVDPALDPMLDAAPPVPAPAEAVAVQQAAYKAFAMTNSREVIGALGTVGRVRLERDSLASELRTLKHTAAVEDAIKARKITPEQRADALASDPDEFRGSMKWARPVVDVEELTARSRITSQTKAPTVEELAADPKLRAYCMTKLGYTKEEDIKAWAQSYAQFGIHFSE